MSHDERRPSTSPLGRLLRLGGLAGRVGSSVLTSRALDITRSADEQRRRRLENLVKNAGRIADTLGELKGGAMKIGQMLSLHEGLMPPEAAEVLRRLQRDAPPVAFEVMEARVRRELPTFDALFASLDPQPAASASIGQVHRGRLRDGRDVVVKIQYPEIDRIVTADLVNSRRVLKRLFELVSEAEFDPIWGELRERLLEELDYEHEAANAREFARAWADTPAVVVPLVVEDASTRHVLTMIDEPGLSLDEAADEPEALRNGWGEALFTLLLRGVYEHRLLHADPNAANFAYRRDGSIVVYDLGCVQRVPPFLATGYARLMRAGIDARAADIPAILLEMGIRDEAGGPLGRDLTDPYVRIFGAIFREAPPYRFGEDDRMYDELIELGLDTWSQQMDVRFPEQILFVQRALSGHFGNLAKLRARGDWRGIASRWTARAPGIAPG